MRTHIKMLKQTSSIPLIILLLAAFILVAGMPGQSAAGPNEFAQAVALIEKGEQDLDLDSLDRAEKILLNECRGPQRDPRCEYYLARIYLSKYSYYSQVTHDSRKAVDALAKAESSGREAIARRPSDPEVHVLMGRVYQHKLARYTVSDFTRMMLDESPVVAEYQRALELDPLNGEAELGLGIYYLYIPRVFGGDGHRARKHFKRAAKYMPEDPEPLVWVSISYREEGRLDDARPFIDRALALDPDDKFVQAEARRLEAAERAQGVR